MRRCLAPAAFADWFAGFLPRLAERAPASLFAPARVSDRSDGKIAHLDGLNLSRAWCWGAIAATVAADDPRRAVCDAAADLHLSTGLPHVAGDYMGEHWLASFAVLALTEGWRGNPSPLAGPLRNSLIVIPCVCGRERDDGGQADGEFISQTR